MVPTEETFSTPLQPDALAHGTHGQAASACEGGWGYFASRVPGASTQHVDASGAAGYPTPGVAYQPMSAPHNASPHDAHAAYNELELLSGQLDVAMREIHRISLVTGVPSPLVRSPIALPTMRLDELAHAYEEPPPRHASPSETVVSFRSYDGSSSGNTLSSADTCLQLPPPAAEARGYWAAPTVKKQDDIFTSKELASLTCSCKKEAVAAWDVVMMGRIQHKSNAAHRVLTYTDAEFAALPAGAAALARGLDSMLAGHYLAVLQGSAPEVELRRSTIASREAAAPGTVTGSGRALRSIILEIINPMYGAELESLEEELKKPFFTVGMDDTKVRLAAHRFEALRAQLPASARGGEREKLRALLEKFPQELASKAKKYKESMCKAEVTKKPYKWTYNELTSLLASHIANVRQSTEVNATDFERRGGGGDGVLFTTKFRGCLHCGLDGHGTRECTEPPCKYCGLRFCWGARKKGSAAARSCLVKRIVEGGSITDSDLGYNGRPMPSQLIEQMKDKAAKMRAARGGGGGEANSAETQTEKNVVAYDLDEELEVASGDSD